MREAEEVLSSIPRSKQSLKQNVDNVLSVQRIRSKELEELQQQLHNAPAQDQRAAYSEITMMMREEMRAKVF
jgi:hypothetical protein